MQERLCRPQAFKGRRGEAALWAVGPKKKGMTIGHALLFGGPSNDNPNYIIQVGNVFGFIISIENVL